MTGPDAINILICMAALGATIAEQRDLYRDIADENTKLHREIAESREMVARKQAELLKVMRDRDAIAAANEMLNRELRNLSAHQERPAA